MSTTVRRSSVAPTLRRIRLDHDGQAGAKPFLPYGRQLIEDDDIAAVSSALRGEFLTTGPLVENFERMLARTVGARDTIACSQRHGRALSRGARARHSARGTR